MSIILLLFEFEVVHYSTIHKYGIYPRNIELYTCLLLGLKVKTVYYIISDIDVK